MPGVAVTDLPIVLLGPVLRRVEPHGVAVFVATREAASVRVAVYEGQVDAMSPPPEIGTAEFPTTRFAMAFHAAVVLVSFSDATSLEPGRLYSYDVRVTPAGGAAQSLKDLGLLKDSTQPGYGTTPLPVDLDVVAARRSE